MYRVLDLKSLSGVGVRICIIKNMEVCVMNVVRVESECMKGEERFDSKGSIGRGGSMVKRAWVGRNKGDRGDVF